MKPANPATIIIAAVFAALLALPIAPLSLAHDYSPGAPQSQPILLRGGDLYTVSNGILKGTDLLFDKGRILALGTNLDLPANTRVIDVTGQCIYPGLIAAPTSLGLVEIGAVRATIDESELGLEKGELKAYVSYNPDSEIIPTIRSNGVTTALVVPGGRMVMGRSSLINLDGWTVEDALVVPEVGLHLAWPRASVVSEWWMEESPEEQKRAQEEERARLRQTFENARAYYVARTADPSTPIDSRWEGFLGLYDRSLPLFVHADDYRQIEQAIEFAKEFGLRMILVGGREAHKAATLLRENSVPVIYGHTQRLPMREDDEYDLSGRIPAMLLDAGIPFCLSTGGGASGVRNLPIQAGTAVAYGLSHDQALRSITLSVAEILGVQKDLGSLEPGKKATLFVSDGDVLDPLTARVRLMFIDGREVDLRSKHTELYEKYRAR